MTRLAYLGSGAFGLPTLARLLRDHEVALVVTQPDRPAGRRRVLTPTPIAAFAAEHGLPTIKPESVNDPAVVGRIRAAADTFVVIAFGQKLGTALLDGVFAVNLHASLLPSYRGAAPIQRAMIDGETTTGVSVITLAQRMDAGEILGRRETAIDARETFGELHDRLAALGPDAVSEVLSRHAAGTLTPEVQDEARATPAPKLSKGEGTVSFDQPAERVRARVHGLTPWPGCTVTVGDGTLKLLRVEVAEPGADAAAAPGTLRPDGVVACAPGAVRLLEVQPPGGRAMSFDAWARGRGAAEHVRLEPRAEAPRA